MNLSSKTLNVATAVVMAGLVAAGITVEQVMAQPDTNELTNPQLHPQHFVNTHPEETSALPEAFVEKIAVCREALSTSSDELLKGKSALSCRPWVTREQDANALTSFHMPREMFFGNDAQEIYEKLPAHEGAMGEKTTTLRKASGDQPEIMQHAWEDGEYGGGSLVIFYPEQSTLITMPWSKSDPGAQNPEAVLKHFGF